jgi:deoxyribodipyrimidine photo-lyase
VFNPTLQTQKFDPSLEYIRRWVPESEGFGYTPPMVDHAMARKRALDVYARALKTYTE